MNRFSISGNASAARRIAVRASLPAAIALAWAGAAQAAPPSAAEARAQAAWRDAIDQLPVPADGCFKASYPTAEWRPVACITAPARPYIPRNGRRIGRTVGDGNDDAAVTATLTSIARGSFPKVIGVKSETGYGGAANTYSLQLNSDFMNTVGCNGTANPGSCQTWQQFVYSSSETAAFMQYWLINYGPACPAGGGWNSYGSDCYKNSKAVGVPQIAISQLASLKVRGTAVKGGNDTMTLTTSTEAYSTNGKDSVVDLATAWKGSEFNIVGDGGGSNAKFNTGSSITVKIGLSDGATVAPACVSNDGTTGETNNLTLGKCIAAGGNIPYVSFVEAN